MLFIGPDLEFSPAPESLAKRDDLPNGVSKRELSHTTVFDRLMNELAGRSSLEKFMSSRSVLGNSKAILRAWNPVFTTSESSPKDDR